MTHESTLRVPPSLCSTAAVLPPCPVTAVCRIIYFLALQLATKEEGLQGESILTRHPPFPIMGFVSCKTEINVINLEHERGNLIWMAVALNAAADCSSFETVSEQSIIRSSTSP